MSELNIKRTRLGLRGLTRAELRSSFKRSTRRGCEERGARVTLGMLGLVRTFGSSNERSGAERERALGAGLMSEPRASPRALGKYDARFREAFRSVPEDEVLLKVYSCALLRDILLQGRLYISSNWLCFYANLFGKDIKVSVPVTSVQLVKKCRTARLLPNGLAVTTDTGQKYVFVSLLSRDSVYDVLRRICTHLQVNGKKSLSPKQHVEEPSSLSLVSLAISSLAIVFMDRRAIKEPLYHPSHLSLLLLLFFLKFSLS
uniref:GRAM domain containing 2A n=1 Tax=Scleropages formosus TaxID=113540 RepID=A0A8C9VJA5_SCLFO